MDALDPVVVDQLRSLARAGNPQLLQRLQESFARDTPPRLHALRAAVAAGDGEAVAFSVHTLTGSAANLGAQGIVATCGLIGAFPVAGEPRELELLLDDLERQAAIAQDALVRLARAA
jgi:HPt (histidine-containing phosphotransfer) domain-containing protein